MSDTVEVWKRTKTLPMLGYKMARSICDQIPCPKITKFRLGYGLVDESGDTPALQAIPDDLDTLPGVFFEGAPTPAASEGRALFVCPVPAGSVPVATKYSCIGLYDQDDDLVAVGLRLPTWITPDSDYTARPFIDFPTEG
ncbi:hypothetical protein JCM15519_04480 [Fundidesulfovibrio butyratiphilus]